MMGRHSSARAERVVFDQPRDRTSPSTSSGKRRAEVAYSSWSAHWGSKLKKIVAGNYAGPRDRSRERKSPADEKKETSMSGFSQDEIALHVRNLEVTGYTVAKQFLSRGTLDGALQRVTSLYEYQQKIGRALLSGRPQLAGCNLRAAVSKAEGIVWIFLRSAR